MHTILPVGLLAISGLLAADTAPFVFEPASIQLDPRLEITVWAAEPDVVDPVALCWDAAGRAYVAECRDYPYGVGPAGQVGSTIRRLEDTNGDGKPDRATVFARELSYVTSVVPWRDGVLAANAPDLTFLRDTDGDGVADVRETILTGFHRGVSDSLVNGLRYGLDNRIHGANGGNGGTLQALRYPGEMLRLGDDDFAWNPATGGVERTARTGGGFGLVFDDFGRGFTTYNINHLQHQFLSRRQAERFPGFGPTDLTGSISDHGEMARLFPISTAQTRPNHPEQAGYFSAAGGLGRIASNLFPDDLAGSFLVCDVVGNLVHRDLIVPDGPIFRASRAPDEQTHEFLASRDPAFRPVALETGPDGALYLLDMQREVIEHPDYIPAKVREKQDLRAGQDRGRIYRIAPKGNRQRTPVNLGGASESELVRQLGEENQWRRLTAQRLLVERRATGATASLRTVGARNPKALARLHALWTLDGLGSLRVEDVRRGLTDTHPGIRENALRLAEPRLPTHAALGEAVLALMRDSQPRVRFVAAQVAGSLPHSRTVGSLAEVWLRDLAFPWTRRAVLSSLPPEFTADFARLILESPAIKSGLAPSPAALQELADLLGARAQLPGSDLSALIDRLATGFPEPVRRPIWDGLAAGLGRSGAKPVLTEAATNRLTELFRDLSANEMSALWGLTRALGLPENVHQTEALVLARAGATNAERPVESRLSAVSLLGLGAAPTVIEPLLALLDAREPAPLQQAALAQLRQFREPAVGLGLIARWRSLGPAIRPAALAVLLERRAFHAPLLDALETDAITVGELNLDLEQRRRLLQGGPAEIRQRAARLMGDEEYSTRKTRVTEWLAKLPPQGDPQRGRGVFEEACSRCHASGQLGRRVGPDLTGITHRSVEDLLSNILDPNMALNPGFIAYTVETVDGEVLTGLLQGETPDAITLLLANEQRVSFPRKSVLKLESSGRSLMPEGLEVGRSPQDLRDVIAFLQSPP
jgi:putative membrane-bound dehydrogenase-like protein